MPRWATHSERDDRREPDNARANYLYAIHVAGGEEGAEPLAYLRKAVRLDPAEAWEAFQELGDGTDFASWCAARGGPARMLP